MALENYIYHGSSEIGYQRTINEDYLSAVELDDTTLFAAIADGEGSMPTKRHASSLSTYQVTSVLKKLLDHEADLAYGNSDLFLREVERSMERMMDETVGVPDTALQPASIALTEMNDIIRRQFEEHKELLLEHPEIFLKEAMLTANRVLGAFKKGNEEIYAGFGASVTCVLLWEGGNFCFAHTGSTRLHLIRLGKENQPVHLQLTQDHTRAKQLLDVGYIDLQEYHVHPDRYILTSALGRFSDPLIQTYTGSMREHDFLLLTTDGIHFTIQPQPIADLVLLSERIDDATANLINAAKSLKAMDNISSLVIWRNK